MNRDAVCVQKSVSNQDIFKYDGLPETDGGITQKTDTSIQTSQFSSFEPSGNNLIWNGDKLNTSAQITAKSIPEKIDIIESAQGIDLEDMITISGDINKDKLLLFSLFKTIPELKKDWEKYSTLEQVNILNVFKTVLSNYKLAQKEGKYENATIDADFAELSEGFYEQLELISGESATKTDENKFEDTVSHNNTNTTANADDLDVVDEFNANNDLDVVERSDAEFKDEIAATDNYALDSYNEPSAYEMAEPSWAAYSEAVAIVQGQVEPKSIEEICNEAIEAIDYQISKNEPAEFPIEIEEALAQAVILSLALQGRAAGEGAVIDGEYVSLKDKVRDLAVWRGNWAESAGVLEALIIETEEVALANAIDSQLKIFGQWKFAMGDSTPDSVIKLETEYTNLRKLLDTNTTMTPKQLAGLMDTYEKLGNGILMENAVNDIMKLSRDAERQTELNFLKGLGVVGIMWGSLFAAEVTAAYTYSWLIELGIGEGTATLSAFIISMAVMTGVQELGEQKLLGAPPKEFLEYLEDYGWMILAMAVIKSPALVKGLMAGKNGAGAVKAAGSGLKSVQSGINLLAVGEIEMAGKVAGETVSKLAGKVTGLAAEETTGDWLTPQVLKQIGGSFAGLTGVEALKEGVHGQDPSNAVSIEALGNRALFLGSALLIGKWLQPWKEGLINKSLNKVWSGYQSKLFEQDMELAEIATKGESLKTPGENMSSAAQLMFKLANDHFRTLNNMKKQFGKGFVPDGVLAKAKDNVTLTKDLIKKFGLSNKVEQPLSLKLWSAKSADKPDLREIIDIAPDGTVKIIEKSSTLPIKSAVPVVIGDTSAMPQWKLPLLLTGDKEIMGHPLLDWLVKLSERGLSMPFEDICDKSTNLGEVNKHINKDGFIMAGNDVKKSEEGVMDGENVVQKNEEVNGEKHTTKSKWLIPSEKVLSPEERQKYWEHTHKVNAYEDVFSTTEDKIYRKRIVTAMTEIGDIHSVLIPGCGSRVFLQQELLAQIPSIEKICCTDFLGVVDIAKQHLIHPRVEYLPKNSTALGFKSEWDAVVIVNSVLSESDQENRDILASCYESLKPGGALIGYFPTIFCSVDIDAINPSLGMSKSINLKKSSFYEEKQGVSQIFYTPLRLRAIFKEIGFNLCKMEIAFCDSDFFVNQGKQYYGLDDEDMVIYELFVVATKLR